MLLSRSIRQRAVARTLNLSAPSTQSRSLFYVPIIQESQEWSNSGIGRLMSADQFKIGWKENQARLIQELNRLTEGTERANLSTLALLIQTARDPDQAQLFNYASMAHNNHFFFKTLSANPTRPSVDFGNQLEDCFSSAASLRATFLATAEAMFAPGFVWLVQRADNKAGRKYAILSTYGAGSPYAAAAFRRQSREMATQDNSSWARNAPLVGFNRGRNQQKTVEGGVEVVPLMCVSTWEHMYLKDFGIGGKRKYLEAWWDCIDWAKVEEHVAKPGNDWSV